MTEAEKDEIERRLVELRDAVLDRMKATEQTYEAELAYIRAEADLRDFVVGGHLLKAR